MTLIRLPEQQRAPRAAVVFDCDGLLVNTQGAWDRAYEALFARYGRSLEPADRRGLVGLQLIPLGHRLAELLGHRAAPHVLGQQLYELVQTNLGAGHAPMPGAVDLVHALAGTRPLAVASNTPAPIVRAYLEPHFDLGAFDAILGSDTAARPKPASDVYLDACTALGCDPRQTVALEDSTYWSSRGPRGRHVPHRRPLRARPPLQRPPPRPRPDRSPAVEPPRHPTCSLPHRVKGGMAAASRNSLEIRCMSPTAAPPAATDLICP